MYGHYTQNNLLLTCITIFRFLQAVQNEKGFVILVGNSWSGEIDRWEDHVFRIPRKNANWVRNDQDHIITLPQMYFLQELVNYILQLDN